jgi:hypothetical protein
MHVPVSVSHGVRFHPHVSFCVCRVEIVTIFWLLQPPVAAAAEQ